MNPAPLLSSVPSTRGVRPVCPCGLVMEREDHGPMGEVWHRYWLCGAGHRWVHEQVDWSEWDWERLA